MKSIFKEALEKDRMGDWSAAHDIVDGLNSSDAAWVHAYLHRKEGDQWNAEYWYGRAGKPVCTSTLQEEWEDLWKYFSSS